MKKRIFYCLLAMLYAYVTANGQTKQLYIGDALPAMAFKNAINPGKSTMRLPNANGRIVILDFFATWCGACVKELPRLAALQDSMKGKLDIWLVSKEPKEKLKVFLQKRPVANAFPIIYSDSILNELFPNRLIPHDVWIDAKGTVAAITSAEYVNQVHLERLAKGAVFALPLKQDMMGYPPAQPMSAHLRGNYGQMQFQQVFTGAMEGAGTVEGYYKEGKLIRHFYYNSPLRHIILSSFRYTAPLPVVFSDAFAGKGLPQQLFCYEGISPASVSDTLRYASVWQQVSNALQIQHTDTTIEWRVIHIKQPLNASNDNKEGLRLGRIVVKLNDRAGCGDPLFITDSSSAACQLTLPEGFWKDAFNHAARMAWLQAQGCMVTDTTERLTLRLIMPQGISISSPKNNNL